jgi:hypothetical protein
MLVVADTSPIHYLVLIQHDAILPALYEQVVIPQSAVPLQGNLPRVRCSHTGSCCSKQLPFGRSRAFRSYPPTHAGRPGMPDFLAVDESGHWPAFAEAGLEPFAHPRRRRSIPPNVPQPTRAGCAFVLLSTAETLRASPPDAWVQGAAALLISRSPGAHTPQMPQTRSWATQATHIAAFYQSGQKSSISHNWP